MKKPNLSSYSKNVIMDAFRIIFLTIATFALNISLGQSTYDHTIDSDALGEKRAFQVSLPKNYHKYEKYYPTVFMLDGEYSFQYAKGVAQFLSNDFGFLPEMIVVSIPNNSRLKDFPLSLNDKRYEEFARFLEFELLPFLKSHYRLNDFCTLYGWSSSSSVCMYALAKKPELFRGLILAGSGIGPNDQKFLEESISTTLNHTSFLYVSTEEGPREKGLERFESLIKEQELDQLVYKFEVLEETSHVAALAEGFYHGINYIFDRYYINQDTLIKGVEAIKSHYETLTPLYGYEVVAPEGALFESSGLLMDNNLVDEAITLLKYGLQHYPRSSSLSGALASIYQRQGNDTLASKYFNQAINHSSDEPALRIKYEVLLNSVKE